MERILMFPDLSFEDQQALLDGPGLDAPADDESKYENPPNSNDLGIAVSVVCLSLVFFTTMARVYSRLVLTKKVKVEDYLAIAALGGYAGMAWAYFTQLYYGGFFVHQWHIRYRTLQEVIYTSTVFGIVYSTAMLFSKTAILFEWVHIFVPKRTRNAFFWGSYAMMALNITIHLSGIIGDALSCIPLATIWEPWLQGKCIDRKVLHIALAYFNLIMDIFILLLPQNTIWRLNMTVQKKIGVSIIFSFGLITIVCAAGRVYANHHVFFMGTGDTNYGLGEIYIWCFTEATCVLLVFNITAIPKIFMDCALSTRIASVTQSLKGRASGSSGNQPSWPHSSGAVKTNAYGMMDDNHSQTQLTDLDMDKAHFRNQSGHGPIEEPRGIIVDTEFEARTDPAPAISTGSNATVYSRQHPWTEG